MLSLKDILALTSGAAADVSKTQDAATQSTIVFLLQKIKAKDQKALIRFIKDENALEYLEDDYKRYTALSVTEAAQVLKGAYAALPLSAVIVLLFIVRSIEAGEPIKLEFKKAQATRAELPPEPEYDHAIPNNDLEWMHALLDKLPTSRVLVTVSEWAEKKRYLPASVTPMPGYYSFEVAPYLREIADCMSINSPVKEVDVMKGAQIGATVGVLENTLGYFIEHVKTAPMMLLTADDGLAKLRIDNYVVPMLEHSKLKHLIQSSDIGNQRKTGKTKDMISFQGGGFLLPQGANSANKLRSTSIQLLLEDEIDSYPDNVGKDGDPCALARDRLQAFYEMRKNVRLSTPLISGRSRIKKGYETGDQRKFMVPCKSCGKKQSLVFKGNEKGNEDERFGFTWKLLDNGQLDYQSVRYLCRYCKHPHRNSDKQWMLARGEWRPTAVPDHPEHRSYHLPAFYSPVGMLPWEAIVARWLKAWDEGSKTVKDVNLLQTFYNNVLAEPFEIIGGKVRFSMVSAHRRPVYRMGEIPNKYAAEWSGSPILFLTCTVDVHKSNLAVAVIGWTRDARSYVIEYTRLNDEDCSESGSKVWAELRAMIEEQVWVSDDGKEYRLALTLVDAGYANDTVTGFCQDYESGVYPILGRDRPGKNQRIKEFSTFETQSGTQGFVIVVDHYKDRLAPVLRREWVEDSGPQKAYHFNAPVDISDKALKELTVETRREKTDSSGHVSYEWYRPGNARNELWDLFGYGHAAVEILAYNICRETFQLETIDWTQFWDYCQYEKIFFKEKPVGDG